MALDRPAWNYILPLVFLLIIGFIFYFDDGNSLYGKAKSTVSTLYDTFVPEISVGENELTPRITDFTPVQQQELQSLKNTLTALASEKSGKNCFASFAGFQEDLGDESKTASIWFDYNSETKSTRVTVYKAKEDVYGQFEIPTLKPCVIAGWSGDTPVAQTFLRKINDQFWLSDEFDQKTPGAYTYNVDTLHIQYSQNQRNGNRIFIDKPYPNPLFVNDESRNFESNGMLFKGENNEICFFSTNWVKNDDEDGIDNDEFTQSDEPASLIYKFNHDQLPLCTASFEFDAIGLYDPVTSPSTELDCTSLTASSRTIGTYYTSLNSLKQQENACQSYYQENIFLNDQGCIAALRSANGCGWTTVRSGEIIPSVKDAGGTKLYTNEPRYNTLEADCLLISKQWKTKDESSILCARNKWKVCNQATLNQVIMVPVESRQESYTCIQDKGVYQWKHQTSFPWLLYSSLELFGVGEGSYPDACTAEQNSIRGACDILGRMGSVETETKNGQKHFPCSSEDNDCDEYFLQFRDLTSNGCRVFISSDTDSSQNNCATALVRFGERINPSPRSFTQDPFSFDTENKIIHTRESEPVSVEQMVQYETFDPQGGLCLLKHRWTIPPSEAGGFLCAPNPDLGGKGSWFQCEARVESKCLDIPFANGNERWCCEKGNKGYEFTSKGVS